MHRADRGLEILDLQNARTPILAAAAAIRPTLASRRARMNFAPRLGLVYRMNEQTVLHRLRRHQQSGSAVVRAAAMRPIRGAPPPRPTTPGISARWLMAFRQSSRRTPAAGRVRLANSATMRTPRARQRRSRHHPGMWNLAFERKLPFDVRSTSPTSAPRVMAATRPRHQCADGDWPSGAGTRVHASFGRNIAMIRRSAPADAATAAADERESSVHQPRLLKGAYTWGQSDERVAERRGRARHHFFNSPSRTRSQLCARRLIARTTSSSGLPRTAPAGRARTADDANFAKASSWTGR